MPRRPSHATVVAYLALVIAMSGTAFAATGGNFLLGKSNSAGHTTALKNTGTGAALKLTAKNTKTAPLSVGKNRTHIKNLNADYLDGISSAGLQRRVSTICKRGSAIVGIGPLGKAACSHEVIWAHVGSDGTLGTHSTGVSSSDETTFAGIYDVLFTRDVTNCARIVTVSDSVAEDFPVSWAANGIGASSQAVSVYVVNSAGDASEAAFDILVVC
jgi:hypothetical protein